MNHSRVMFFLCAILAGSLSAQVHVVDPVRDAYVSGPYQVVLEADGADDVVQTLLFVDDQVVFDQPGWHAVIPVDFGEDIEAHRIYARILLGADQALESSVVRTRELRINVTATSEVILLTAVVKDRRNNALTGLDKDRFTVLENGRPLKITSFYNEYLPLDLVFLLDTSSSLKVKGVEEVKAAAAAFLEQLEPADRVNLYEFKTEPHKLCDFTNDRKQLLAHIKEIEPLGETALFDTLMLGLKEFKGRQRGRKALVLFTDGRDSLYEEPADKARLMRAAITRAQNQEVSLFTIGLGNRVHQDALERMALETGGRFHQANGAADLHRIFGEIVDDLKHQYVLGVHPQSKRRGFQRLAVQVRKRGAQVFTRSGYTR